MCCWDGSSPNGTTVRLCGIPYSSFGSLGRDHVSLPTGVIGEGAQDSHGPAGSPIPRLAGFVWHRVLDAREMPHA